MRFVIVIIGALLGIMAIPLSSLALPVYQNYSGLDLFTLQTNLGYATGSSEFTEVDYVNDQLGGSISLAGNVFYNLNYLHNIFIGGNILATTGVSINNNIVLATASYNWQLPDTNFGLTMGVGIGAITFKVKSNSFLSSYNLKLPTKKATAVFISGTYFGSKLGYPNVGLYSGFKFITANNLKIVYNTANNYKYHNYFAEIGVVYKLNYLEKVD